MTKGTTRKSKGPKPMTIPHLRKAFDHIDAWIESRVHKEGVKKLVPAFQAEWKKVFRRNVDTKAAEAYLSLKHTATPRVTKKQKGGSAVLAGAPLDYMTRPGVTGPYGSFPAYLSDGMLPYPADSVSAQCGKIDITPNVPVDIGSNKFVGGNRPFQNGSPPTTGSIAVMAAKGVDVATPTAQNTVYTVQAYNPATLTTSPALVSQNLPAQLTRGPL
jgi:hypothetical protein